MEENKISSDLIRGHIDTIILYSLTGSDKFAQQISDFIEEKSEKKYQINQATLYSSLKRLENLKYVTSYRFDCDDGRRKFFKITELGNEFVKDNLSNWSYSRVIIDKLMGCEYTPHVYITHNNDEKPQESTSEINTDKTVLETPIINQPSQAPTLQIIEDIKPSVVSESETDIKAEQTAKMETTSPQLDSDEKAEDKKEINFRNILNGLIKNAEKPVLPVKEEKQKIEITDLGKATPSEVVDKKIEQKPVETPKVAKFNETIKTTSYSQKAVYVGKADFSDLVGKYAVEGYRIRVSSKSSVKSIGNLYLNKLRFFSILCFLAIPLIEILLLQFAANITITSSIPTIVALSLTVISFFTLAIIYLKDKNKSVFKTITFDGILNACIAVFNLLLLIFALNFVISVDLSVKFNLLSYLVVPIVASINIILYFVIELLLYKTGKFKPAKQ